MKNKNIFVTLLLLLSFLWIGELYSQTFRVKIVKVIDGDTFTALNRDKLLLKFRMYGIDAPERGQPFSKKSQQALAAMIDGKRVKVTVESSDPWGRFVVKVQRGKIKDVGGELLAQGLAWHYKKFDTSQEYNNLEIEAKKLKRELWRDPNPIPPWEWRRK